MNSDRIMIIVLLLTNLVSWIGMIALMKERAHREKEYGDFIQRLLKGE